MHPRELFERNVYSCFIDEEVGLRLRHDIGVGNIMWELDYPHSDSTWPDARTRAAELFSDVPDDEVRRIVETNARTLFRFPREQ